MVSATTRLLVLLSLAGTLLLTSCDLLDIVGLESGRYSLRPNEPAGFATWFEHDWQTWPTENERMFASGVGVVRVERGVDNFELIDDPDAPHGKGKSLRHRQREGQRTGTTSGTFNLFNPIEGTHTRHSNQVHLRSVYRSHWVYFEPDPQTGDWQFGDNHMRTFWANRHYGTSHANVSLRSPSDARPPNRHSTWRGPRMWHSTPTQGYTGPSDLTLELGRWYHMEYLWEPEGEYGVEDGMTSRIRAWIDGELVIDRTITHTITAPFANDHFAMVWLGGPGGVREQDDFIRFGDIYISGTLYE